MKRAMIAIGLLAGGGAGTSAAPCVDAAPELASLGAYVVVGDGAHAQVVRRDADCAHLVGALPDVGRIAIVSLRAAADAAQPPEVVIDTWLYHGDRARHRMVWTTGGYVELGTPETIPGPRKPR